MDSYNAVHARTQNLNLKYKAAAGLGILEEIPAGTQRQQAERPPPPIGGVASRLEFPLPLQPSRAAVIGGRISLGRCKLYKDDKLGHCGLGWAFRFDPCGSRGKIPSPRTRATRPVTAPARRTGRQSFRPGPCPCPRGSSQQLCRDPQRCSAVTRVDADRREPVAAFVAPKRRRRRPPA